MAHTCADDLGTCIRDIDPTPPHFVSPARELHANRLLHARLDILQKSLTAAIGIKVADGEKRRKSCIQAGKVLGAVGNPPSSGAIICVEVRWRVQRAARRRSELEDRMSEVLLLQSENRLNFRQLLEALLYSARGQHCCMLGKKIVQTSKVGLGGSRVGGGGSGAGSSVMPSIGSPRSSSSSSCKSLSEPCTSSY